ncbi:MAG TPA: c-type cytochrome, partial [Gemmatimonadales bacterium]|nr:c-type cytochrome [Gemmatimonadales bacterium]
LPTTSSLIAILGLSLAGCAGRRGEDVSGPAPVDSGTRGTASSDTITVPDTLSGPTPAGATPPITAPSPAPQDTPPGGAQPDAPGGPKVSQAEYEGWRQYSVNCARCHGQDVLPNPVAANLLVSLAPGGPIDTEQKFYQVVNDGRPERGMPAFKGVLTEEQIGAIYAYVQGRADKRIPPGRPARPAT